MSYSQNNEEGIVLEYFGSHTGRVLEIGANDGKTLSNSLALIERGWEAVLVEPDPVAYARLLELHKDNSRVQCFPIALGNAVGNMEFHSSGTLLNTDDISLVSTLVPKELKRWRNVEFRSILVDVTDWEHFQANQFRYDFISIDAEGMDLEIVKQMDLQKLGCRMLCIEWNSKDRHLYDGLILPQGYTLYAMNAENLIYSCCTGATNPEKY
jgi:FkbM family methyltransferase